MLETFTTLFDGAVRNHEVVRNLSLAAGTIAAITIGSIFAWIRTAAAHRQSKTDAERRITDNFIRAIEQLGHVKMSVRLGAIYTLERISKESSRDHWPIMETLTGACPAQCAGGQARSCGRRKQD